VADWIKTVGAKNAPYTQKRHLSWGQRYVWFPGSHVNVAEGDRLFLYTGHNLRRFFGICRVMRAPAVTEETQGIGRVRCPVFVLLLITDLARFGLKAEEVMPLPGGTRTISLRQQSHVRIEEDDALRLTARLTTALYRELSAQTREPVQSSVFSLRASGKRRGRRRSHRHMDV